MEIIDYSTIDHIQFFSPHEAACYFAGEWPESVKEPYSANVEKYRGMVYGSLIKSTREVLLLMFDDWRELTFKAYASAVDGEETLPSSFVEEAIPVFKKAIEERGKIFKRILFRFFTPISDGFDHDLTRKYFRKVLGKDFDYAVAEAAKAGESPPAPVVIGFVLNVQHPLLARRQQSLGPVEAHIKPGTRPGGMVVPFGEIPYFDAWKHDYQNLSRLVEDSLALAEGSPDLDKLIHQYCIGEMRTLKLYRADLLDFADRLKIKFPFLHPELRQPAPASGGQAIKDPYELKYKARYRVILNRGKGRPQYKVAHAEIIADPAVGEEETPRPSMYPRWQKEEAGESLKSSRGRKPAEKKKRPGPKPRTKK